MKSDAAESREVTVHWNFLLFMNSILLSNIILSYTQNVTVYCGASFGVDERYQEITRKLGEWIGKNNYNLVYGGGRSGLMGLIADSVLENGGKVTGIITHFLSEREIAHDGITKLIKVDTMSERKKKMADLADIFIALPGGPGTLEEITEVVSWAVLALHPCPCIFFNFDNIFFTSLFQLLSKLEKIY